MEQESPKPERAQRDVRIVLAWVVALIWLVAWLSRAVVFWRIGGSDGQGAARIHAAIYLGTALLPAAFLATRDRPDARREEERKRRSSQRLSRRTKR